MLTPAQPAGATPEANLRTTQVIKYARDLSWLWNPGHTSPEVKNRGISGDTKTTEGPFTLCVFLIATVIPPFPTNRLYRNQWKMFTLCNCDNLTSFHTAPCKENQIPLTNRTVWMGPCVLQNSKKIVKLVDVFPLGTKRLSANRRFLGTSMCHLDTCLNLSFPQWSMEPSPFASLVTFTLFWPSGGGHVIGSYLLHQVLVGGDDKCFTSVTIF